MAKDKYGKTVVAGDLVQGKPPGKPYWVNAKILEAVSNRNEIRVACISHDTSMLYYMGNQCVVICHLYWVVSTEYEKIEPGVPHPTMPS